MKQLIHYILIGALLCLAAGCKDDDKFTTSTGAILAFSADSIRFDTVFTAIGSSTKRFVVYNNNKDGVRIANVSFRSGGAAGFRLNVDGQYGASFDNVDVLGSDSLFCFVEVTVNPQDSDSPFVIDDQIVFTLESGVRQMVNLQAWGQDVIVLKDYKITEDETLTANRPYLIEGVLTIDSLAELTIEPGASLYFHAGSFIDCYGSIYADGAEGAITFRGDRTDRILPYLPYDRLDNQWLGICLNLQSHDNYFNNVDIHGGSYGIVGTDTATTEIKLEMYNSVVHNVGGNGLHLTNCLATVANTQISNCRGNCVELFGGKYQFSFCTIAQFCPWTAERGNAFVFYNALVSPDDKKTYYLPLEMLNVTNCLVTGYDGDEVYGTPLEPTASLQPVFNFQFQNCLLTTKISEGYESYFKDCVLTEEGGDTKTNFRTIDTYNYIYDFRLSESSQARGIGTSADGILDDYPADRLGVERSASAVDAGCYQFQ